MDLLSAVSRNRITLMPFDILICLFPDLLLPLVLEVPPQYSGCCWRETGFSSSVQQQLGKPITHSLISLSPRERSPPASLALQCHLKRGSAGKVPLILSSVSKLVFFSPKTFWNLPSGKLDFYKVPLV